MKAKPEKTVKRIVCPKCGELMLKIYPYSTMWPAEAQQIPPCKKCLAKGER